jgi:hypothetical protein
MPRHRRPLGTFLLLVALALAVAACGPAPAPSFSAEGPCDGDGRVAGTYPALEALLPTAYEGRTPDTIDSGRTCTAEGLDVLADAGVTDLRFAGANWDLGGGRGLTFAVFQGDGVTVDAMISFYEDGARGARRTEDLTTTETTVAGRPARRLDVLWGQTGQSIVAWPSEDGERVNVLLAADIGDTAVEEALALFGNP